MLKQLITKSVFYLWAIIGFNTISNIANAQNSLTGTVTSALGEPVSYVTVTIKRTGSHAVTDSLGGFRILSYRDNDTLLFTAIGWENRVELINGRKNVNVILLKSANVLDEIVVIGYGEQRRSDLTGSIASIKNEDLTKSRAISFIEAMQGRIAGVQVTSNSGEPGAGVSVNIRGSNSVDAGTQPLYVIDGLQIDVNTREVASNSYDADVKYNPLSSINPSDIESIEVLKDASASAIYGSRAANGVIIVTTKKGTTKNPKINFNGYWGFGEPVKKIEVLEGNDYLDYKYARDPRSLSWGVDTNDDGVADKIRDINNFSVHNWQNELLHKGLIQNYNLGLTAGTGNSNVAVSFGYLDQDGILKNNNFKRYTAAVKGGATFNKKLTISGDINFSHTISSGAAATALGANSYTGVVQSFIIYRPLLRGVESEEDIAQNGGVSNPLTIINNAFKEIGTSRLLVNGGVKYDFNKNLSLNIYGGGILSYSKAEAWFPSITSWGAPPVNGLAMIDNSNSIAIQNSNTLTYNKVFNQHHQLNAMAGIEINQYSISTFGTRATGFENQSFNPVYDINQGSVFPDKVESSKIKNNRLSQFGRLNYSFKGKYLLTATLRRDGSSKFGQNNKYALFPSWGVAWKLNKENLFSKINFINELKIRATYGLTGNDRIPEYRSLSRTDRAYYGNSSGGVDLGLAPAEAANPNLKWETTSQLDFGVDLSMFKGRITIVADWYKKQTTDMLLQVGIPSQTGSSRQWQNIGQINNEGIEFAFTTRNISTKNFSWNTSFNINTNKNKVVSLGSSEFLKVTGRGGHIQEIGRLIPGYPIGMGWGFIFDGIYQKTDFNSDGTPVAGIPSYSGVVVKPGDIKFKDLDGDGVITPGGDKTFISNSNPKHFGGFSNSFQFKKIELDIFLQWSSGNGILNTGRYRYEGNNAYYNVTYDYYRNHWTNDNASNLYPSYDGRFRDANSSFYAEDGSFLRLKNLRLAYNFSSASLRRLKISNINLYLTAENLITWTKYSGLDPEVSYHNKLITGFDDTVYPRPRVYTIGLNVSF